MFFGIERWLVGGLIGAIIGAFIAIIAIALIFFISEYRRQKTYKGKILSRLDTADMLLQESMPIDALAIYTDILKDVSREKDPETYSLIKNSEGRCY